MSFWSNLFPKKKSKENIEAHKVVEKKADEAQGLLEDIQGKMEEAAKEIDTERLRTNKIMNQRAKTIRDIAQQIAIITGRTQ